MAELATLGMVTMVEMIQWAIRSQVLKQGTTICVALVMDAVHRLDVGG